MLRFSSSLLAALLVATAIVPPMQASAQSNSRQGCLNQWLFNGVWRAKITKVEPIMDGANQTGWKVTQVWRNGTARELAPADSQFKAETLHLSGTALEGEGHNQQVVVFNTFAPSGQLTYAQSFFGPNMHVDPSDKPKSLDITFDGATLSRMDKPHFTSSKYNFHYNLGCVATGAAAEAQGGSTQLAAKEGCMNSWLSNGVWKMRVLAVHPNPPDTTAQNQNGWLVKQQWVNITHMKVFAGVLPDIGHRVAPTNVSDEFLATKSGNNASSANVVGGFHLGAANHLNPFLPGVPFTFEQFFSGGNLDPADAPIRLLVAFDTAAQDKVNIPIPVPHYRMPADFRINLTCGGTVTMAPGWQTLHTPAPGASAQPAAAAQPPAHVASNGSNRSVDPCGMLGAPDVASALGVGVRSLGSAQRPSPNECAWAVASHAGTPARAVLLTMQPVQAAKTCHGLGCLHIVQSVMNTLPGLPGMPPAFSQAFDDAQMLSGLGDKAAWKDGKLTVVKADMAFQLLVQGTHSSALATSENLARTVLYHLSVPR